MVVSFEGAQCISFSNLQMTQSLTNLTHLKQKNVVATLKISSFYINLNSLLSKKCNKNRLIIGIEHKKVYFFMNEFV